MRLVVLCPGRGSYTRSELGILTGAPDPTGARAQVCQRADALRAARGLPTVSGLDRAERFGSLHRAGENAAALIFTGAAQDLAESFDPHEIVAVAGNSMGFYIALLASGVLGFDDAFRVADTMGGLGRPGESGGQIVYPLVDDAWRVLPERVAAVEGALGMARAAGHFADWSIRLGGQAVLGADAAGIRSLLTSLPAVRLGERDYPFQLLGHAAFHTPLMSVTASEGRRLLADVPWRAPRIPLIDGRGTVFRPLTTRPADLASYTLDHQVVRPFDFTAAVSVALREYAPDALVLLGPGDSLGGAIGQILVAQRWQGVASKAAFLERQRSDRPLLFALGRPEQRRALSSR